MLFIKRLIWDNWNIGHIARHDVVPEEAEEACLQDPLVQEGNKGRIVLIGSTKAGRVLEVVLDPESNSGVYYPVTAHTASKKDRKLYQEYINKKGSDEAE